MLLIAANYWALRHLQVGLDHAGWLAGLSGTVAGAIALGEKVIGKNEQQIVKRWVGKVSTSLLSPGVLTALYLLFGAVVLTVSSIDVVGHPDLNAPLVSLKDLKGQARTPLPLDKDSNSTHFVVISGPFGRIYSLKVSGFLEKSFTVYPVIGLIIAPAQDLLVSPSVLIRPDPVLLRFLEDHGRIEVDMKSGNGETPVFRSSNTRSSFMLGAEPQLPLNIAQGWQVELTADGLDAQAVARTIRDWQNPVVNPKVELHPNDKLEIRFYSSASQLVGHRDFTVPAERFGEVRIDFERTP